MLHTEQGLRKCFQSIPCRIFSFFWRVEAHFRCSSMQQPQFDSLQQHPMCRWPIFTGLLALLVGLSVINCGNSAPAWIFRRRLAHAEWQRDARCADEPADVTHGQPSTVDLGKRCGATSRRGQVWHVHAGAGQPTTIQSSASRATSCFTLPRRSKHSSSGYSSRHRTRAWRF